MQLEIGNTDIGKALGFGEDAIDAYKALKLTNFLKLRYDKRTYKLLGQVMFPM